MSLDRVEKFWNQIYIKTIALFIYTSTFKTKSTELFQYTDDFNNSLKMTPILVKIEPLIWLYKYMLPDITIGKLYAS